VRVVGYTDGVGSPRADLLLWRQRIQTVADALVANSVAADRLARDGGGQTGEPRGLANRRVEIALAAD
jgi:outer membrane protein OmpA-like peptidoglycan-associated protein